MSALEKEFKDVENLVGEIMNIGTGWNVIYGCTQDPCHIKIIKSFEKDFIEILIDCNGRFNFEFNEEKDYYENSKQIIERLNSIDKSYSMD